MHVKTVKKRTFGAYEIGGWYIGPSMNHYRSYTCWIWETGGIRNANTVEFTPQKSSPTVDTITYLQQAASDIIHLLQTPEKPTINLKDGNKITNAYIKIATVKKIY